MAIWLPPRRLATQPQTIAHVDWSNPNLKGVGASIVQVGGLSGFAVNRGRLIASPVIGGTVVTDGTNAGLALKFDGTSTFLDYGTANIPAVEFTVMWGGIFDANDSPRGIFDCTNNGVSGWNIYQDGASGMYFNNSSYPAGNPTTGWTVGAYWNGALRNKGGVSADWWRNGTKVASGTGVSPTAPTLPFWVGKLKVGGLPFMKARFSYFYLFDKFLDDAAIISLQGNPYQIFNSQRVIWSSTAAAGDAVGAASGIGSASGIGASINAQSGSSSGIGAASGVGASVFSGVGSSSGTGSASGIGASDFAGVGSSSGTSTADGVGTSSTGSFGTASGSATVNGVGASTVDSVGSGNGVASVSGVSASEAATVASASGSATVSGVGDSIVPGSAVGAASGSSSVSGVGASIVAAVGSADGSAAVVGRGASSGGNVEHFAGGYVSREERAEQVRKQRVELGIIEEEKPSEGTGLEQFEISNLVQKKPVKGADPKKSEKRIIALEQERIKRNEELKRLIQLEIDREEEQIIRLLMEM